MVPKPVMAALATSSPPLTGDGPRFFRSSTVLLTPVDMVLRKALRPVLTLARSPLLISGGACLEAVDRLSRAPQNLSAHAVFASVEPDGDCASPGDPETVLL